MRLNRRVLFLSLSVSLLFMETGITAQDLEEEISRLLVSEGFENVGVLDDVDRLIVTYENRRYRFEIRGMREVVRLLTDSIGVMKDLTIIPQYRGIPIVAVNFNQLTAIEADRSNDQVMGDVTVTDVSFNVEPYWSRFENIETANSSTFKFDIVLHPQFRARFGNYDEPVESQINIAPAVTTSLWRGMSLFLQWIVPLQNELGPEGDFGRPGLLTLNQMFRLPLNTFVSATAGYFTQHRYGLDVEAKTFLMNGRCALGANVGYTGYASYLEGIWYYSDLYHWTYAFSGEYRVATLDFTVKATYAQFVYGDRGVRLDVSRQFDEVDIGFFALLTEEGSNGGFNFSVPIFPPKRLKPKRIRVDVSRYFPWEYKYRGLPDYGIRYSVGDRIDGFVEKLNPSFISHQF